MKVKQSLTGASATGAGSVYQSDGLDNQKVQYAISGTFVGTVAIEGSIDGTTYLELATSTTPATAEVSLMPFMRANVTAYTSGAIDAALILYPL